MTIDLDALHQALSATDAPSLPSLTAQHFALQGMWAVVLATLAVALLRRRSRGLQMALFFCVLGLTLLPGSLSPAYWLGLAFLMPSWMSVVLCLAWLYQHFRRLPVAPSTKPMRMAAYGMAALGVLLGWPLLGDMLAWFPFAQTVYAWGFSSWAVSVAVVIAVAPWLVWGGRLVPPQADAISVLALPIMVLVIFVFTRLPSGNLWDALLDPWLWLLMQAFCIVRMLHYCRVCCTYSDPTPSLNKHP